MKQFDPNAFTQAEIDAIIKKFVDHNQGVVIGNPYTVDRNYSAVSTKWADLKSTNSSFSLGKIIHKMNELYRKIVTTPQDDILGDMSVAFESEDDRGNKVPFLFTDLYMFCREAVKIRQATEDYKDKMRKLQAAKEYRNKNKSKDEILRENEAIIANLEAELGISSPVQATSAANEPASA